METAITEPLPHTVFSPQQEEPLSLWETQTIAISSFSDSYNQSLTSTSGTQHLVSNDGEGSGALFSMKSIEYGNGRQAQGPSQLHVYIILSFSATLMYVKDPSH